MGGGVGDFFLSRRKAHKKHHRKDGKMKKSFCLMVTFFLLGLLLFTPKGVMAADGYLTLPQAIQLALEHNMDYQIALLIWENATIQSKISALDPPRTEEERIRWNIDKRGSEEDLEKALTQIILNTLRNYLRINTLILQEEILRLQLNQATDSYQLVKEKVALGLLNERNLLEEENRLQRAQLSYDGVLQDLKGEKDSFFMGLGIDDDKFQLDPDPPLDIPSISLIYSQAKDLYLVNSFTLWEREMRLRLSEINLEKMRLQGVAPLELKMAENRHQIDLFNYEKASANLMDQFQKSWYRLEEFQTRLLMAEREYLLAERDSSLKEKEYQLALITDTDILHSQIALLQAKRSLLDSMSSYYQELLALKIGLGLSLAPLLEEEGVEVIE